MTALKNAPIGAVLKPPKAAVLSLNGFVVMYESDYEVVRKDAKNYSVWVNPVPKKRAYTDPNGLSLSITETVISGATKLMGLIQVAEGEEWLEPDDGRPEDLEAPLKALPKASDKRVRGGPGSLHEFAFDDDDISLEDCPHQAQVIADILLEEYRKTKRNSWTETEIENILNRPEAKARVASRQPLIRIFKFYRPEYQRKNLLRRRT